MKQIFLFATALSVSALAFPQVLWSEDFGTGCNQNQLVTSYSGTNGAWTMTSTGVNGNYANTWYVSATEANTGLGNCGDGCISTPALTDRTLHVSNVADSECGCFWGCQLGDCGAAYDACAPGSGFGLCNASSVSVQADKRAESPTINCSGQSSITLDFLYIMAGQAGADFATVWYYDGATWTQLAAPAPSANAGCLGQGRWTSFSVALPGSANNNANVRIGFRWVNNQDDIGTDPSFAVDDITLSSASPCSGYDVAITAQTDVSCNGGNDGTATGAATNGTAPFTYAWSNSQTTATATGLSAGPYWITITDDNGCVDSAVVTIIEPNAINLAFTTVDATCGQSDGSATVNPSGGTPPYTYAWSNSQSTQTATNLAAGSYSVTVTDSQGCTANGSVSVNNLNGPTLSVVSVMDASCAGVSDGEIVVSASSGTPPYMYSIDGVNFQASATFTGLASGSYTLTVRDDNGCEATIQATVGELSSITLNVDNVTDVSCNGGSDGEITVSGTGGTTPYDFSVDGVNFQSSGTFSGLSAGSYNVTVRDVNGCIATTSVTVSGPAALTVNAGPDQTIVPPQTAQINASSSDPTSNYAWSPSAGLSCTSCADPIASPTSTTTYTVTATDANGCMATDEITITVLTALTIGIPNAFSPNNDGLNDNFQVFTAGMTSYHIRVFNRWGQVVFESTDAGQSWDGSFSGELQPMGVYAFILSGTASDNSAVLENGNITLLR